LIHLFTALKGRSATESAPLRLVFFARSAFGWSSLGRSAALRDGLRRKEGILITSFHGPKGPFFHRTRSHYATRSGHRPLICGARKGFDYMFSRP
jgi:hypothetical protein